MKNERVKKSLEKSKNVLEEKRKIFKRKICIKKTYAFTIIAMNFIQEQSNNTYNQRKFEESLSKTHVADGLLVISLHNVILLSILWARLI